MEKPIITGKTIKIPSDQNYLADVDVFVEELLRGFGVGESVIADIAISVSEIVNNAIVHGNRAITAQPVEVSVNRENGTVAITIRDCGSGFDPETVENPIDDGNLMKEVGRGIFIVRSLMDDVVIKPSSDGTVVTIKKAIA